MAGFSWGQLLSAGLVSGGCLLGGGFLLWRLNRPQAQQVPAKMKQAFLVEGHPDIAKAKIEIREVDVPKPASGEVLIKVLASPVNPSDDGVWKREGKTVTPMGIECSGVVVASGGGLYADSLIGKQVAAVPGGGAYGQYVTANAMKGVYRLPAKARVEDYCSFFVNPFTAVGILESVRELDGPGLIHTAGASQLGLMLAKLCLREGVALVSVVRRTEQKDKLVELGVEPRHVVVTDAAGTWKAELSRLATELKITHAFDAIAGEMTGDLVSLMPPGSLVWVYGRLSDQPVSGIAAIDLIYRRKRLHGFYLLEWLTAGGTFAALRRTIRVASIVREYFDDVFSSHFVDASLEDFHSRYIELRRVGQTGSKLRVRPWAQEEGTCTSGRA